MKLDRNKNENGTGKYALVNLRKLTPVLEKGSKTGELTDDEAAAVKSFSTLLRLGYITLGNETPGDQFFVMKYKDKFTAPALHAYAIQAEAEAIITHSSELKEFAQEMFIEAKNAEKLGKKIPD